MFKIFKKATKPQISKKIINKVEFFVEFNKEKEPLLTDFQTFWKDVTVLKEKYRVNVFLRTSHNRGVNHLKIEQYITLSTNELLSKDVMDFFKETSELLENFHSKRS